MNSHNNKRTLKISLSDFITVLGDESVSATGYGVYAHLSFSDIDQLFIQFQGQSVSVREFSKKYIRTL